MSLRAKVFVLSLVIAAVAFATQMGAVAEGTRYRDPLFASVTVTSDVAYGEAPDEFGQVETLRLDLYQPAGDTEASRPAFVWVHGGGFATGDKADALEALIGETFARRGYVVASVNYRMREGEYYGFGIGDPRLPEVIADAQHDVQAAVRWLRANAAAYHVDPARIGVGGFSAGAVAALYVSYNSSDPGESGNPGYPSSIIACVDVSGDIDVSLIDTGEPPVLVVHGTADIRVPYQGALDIVARARELGVTAEFHPIEGAGHVVWEGSTAEVIGLMSDFLYRHLAPQTSVEGNTPEPPDTAADNGGSNAWLIVLASVGVGVLALAAGVLFVRMRRYSVRRR